MLAHTTIQLHTVWFCTS